MSALDDLKEIDIEEITPLQAAIVFLSHKHEGDAAIAAEQLEKLNSDYVESLETVVESTKHIFTLQDTIEKIEANYDALQTPMSCGHLARYAVNDKESTQYCALCDRNAQMIVLETVADVLNKTVTCMQLLREVDDRVPGLLFDHYDVNSISLGVRINNAIIKLDKANNQ